MPDFWPPRTVFIVVAPDTPPYRLPALEYRTAVEAAREIPYWQHWVPGSQRNVVVKATTFFEAVEVEAVELAAEVAEENADATT